jgi:hypothetical protein
MLAVYQIDLLAQLERQLRAVRETMRHIETLRTAKHRVGPELSNGQRQSALTRLDDEIAALDSQLSVEHVCCQDMHDTIVKMQERLTVLRRRTFPANGSTDDASP